MHSSILSFNKSSKLTSQDYKKVFDNRLVKRERFFLSFYKTNNFGKARLGLAISKKHVKRSVDRNRIKRIIRESFRVAMLSNLDYVFVAKKGLNKISKQELHDSLKKIWEK